MTKLLRRIDENVSVPVKIVVPIVSAIVMATIWIQNTLWSIRILQSESWTRPSMQVWTERLREKNPQVFVPVISEIGIKEIK